MKIRRLNKTVQTHTSASAAPTNGTTLGNFPATTDWIDTENFDKVVISVLNEGVYTHAANAYWSHDKANVHIDDVALTNNSANQRSATLEVKAQYFKLRITNTDASVRSFNAWAYFKS